MYAKPFQSMDKNKLRIVAFILCIIFATSVFIPAYADTTDENEYEMSEDYGSDEDEGYVTDAILVGIGHYIVDAVGFAGELFIKLLTVSFSPSINPLLNIEQGLSFSTPIADDVYYDGASIDNSFTIMAIWEFAFMFGNITCTLLMFFYLFMCLVGQQEQIRDTPFMLLVKYVVSLFLIYMSKYCITAFIDFFNDMWTNLVLTKDITTPETYTAFLPIWWENGDFEDGNLVVFGMKVLSHGGTKMSLLALLGSSSVMTGGATTPLFIGIVCIVLFFALYFGWKIIKEFMKLLLEVVERYFVLFILLAFFPAVASTLVSNNSKKIFYAYIKMLYSQGFLLLINTVFMAIFFKILLAGGWGAGLINYIGALAFLRICQRIDAYMAQLGINIVQTGGGLMSACGSVFGGALAGMSALRGADRTRKNVGASLMQKAVTSGNAGMYDLGKKIGTSGSDIMTGNTTSFKDNMATYEKERNNYLNNNYGGTPMNITNEVKQNTLSAQQREAYDKLHKENPTLHKSAKDIENANIANAVGDKLGFTPEQKEALANSDMNLKDVKGVDIRGNNYGFVDENGNNIGMMNVKDKSTLKSDRAFHDNDDYAREQVGSMLESKAGKQAIADELGISGVDGRHIGEIKPITDKDMPIRTEGSARYLPYQVQVQNANGMPPENHIVWTKVNDGSDISAYNEKKITSKETNDGKSVIDLLSIKKQVVKLPEGSGKPE
ncbi:MAG: hypothetical protein J6A75_03430 [Lachnospiraceae bacterium]|nr:hypothetical protein [Lachnospiraceae bacterium]